MNAFLRKVGSKVLGTLAGAVTGLAAGFLPGYYTLLLPPAGGLEGVLYILSLPFLMLWHMGRGAFEGAKNGLLAGLTYPKEVNDWYSMLSQNDEVHNTLQQRLAQETWPNILLSDQEEKQFKSLLKQEKISEEKREYLAVEFAAYKNYVKTTNCALTGKPLKELRYPLVIKLKNQDFICDYAAFEKLVKECCKKKIPVNFGKSDKPAAEDIITAKDIFIMTACSQANSDFVDRARKLISSVSIIQQSLGISVLPSTSAVSPKIEKQQSADNEFQIFDLKHNESFEKVGEEKIENSPRVRPMI